MTSSACSAIIADPAPGMVQDAWSTFRAIAFQGVDLTLDQIQSLNDFSVQFQRWDASFQADGVLSGFRRPSVPDLPGIPDPTAITIPQAPSLNIPAVSLDLAPTEPAALDRPPSLNLVVNAPDPVTDVPDDAPTLNLPDAPALPTLSFPAAAPELDAIALPDAPEITIDAFAEAAPEFDAAVPNEVIAYASTDYASDLLDQVKAKISTILEGGTGLPAAIEAALASRAADRDDAAASKLVQEVLEEHAGRGFEEPNGILARRLLEARQANRNARAATGREIRLQNAQIEVENLRFAVSTGLQAELAFLQAHLATEDRKFQFAVKTKELAITVFNAHVARFNAVVTVFNARVDAYRAFLDGQRARVDVYRGQVEAAKVGGEINEQRVRAYEAQIRAEVAKAEAGRSLIEAFRARIDGERARIEAHRNQVETYRARIDAYRAEWEGEKARLEAQVQQGRIYESVVSAYASRVSVWNTKQQARFEQHRTHLTTAQATLQRYDAQVRAVLAGVNVQELSIRARQAQGEQLARLYEAEARVEGAAVDADGRSFALETERERARIDALLNDARLQVEQLTTIRNLLLRARESAAQASSQIASSAMSAVSFGVSASSSQSRSQSCSTNLNYDGEIADL